MAVSTSPITVDVLEKSINLASSPLVDIPLTLFIRELKMTTDAQRDGMISDAKSLIGDANDIVESMAGASEEKLATLGKKLRAKLDSSKEKISEAQQALAERAKATAHATDTYVHENPWRVVGAAVALGVALGLLINRR